MRFANENGIWKSNDRLEILSKGFWKEKVWFEMKHILAVLKSRTQKTKGNNHLF